jgi:protein gp37
MGDLFHEDVPFEFIDQVMCKVAMRTQHTFIILTKRPERMKKYFCDIANNSPSMIDRIIKTNNYPKMHQQIIRLRKGKHFTNLHLGVSVENQQTADERIPILLQIPAAVRFVSAEPLLGALDLRRSTHIDLAKRQRLQSLSYVDATRLDQVIVGGESGPGARPMHPAWVRSIRDQCKDDGVSFFFKQQGAWKEVYSFRSFQHWVNKAYTRVDSKCICLDLSGTACRIGKDFRSAKYPISVMRKVGKTVAGRLLDGVTHDELQKEGA